MRQMKKMLSLLIALSMIAGLGSYFPKPVFAMSSDMYNTYKASVESKYSEAERLAFKEKIDSLEAYKGRNESLDGTLYQSSEIHKPAEISIEQILYYLIEYKNVFVSIENESKWLNPYIYQKYKIVAYDNLSVIEKEQRGHGSFERVDALGSKELEYRYLGYSDANIEITNDFYPADFKSGTNPLSRTYKSDAEANGSWKKFNSDKYRYGQIYQMMNTQLLNDDDTEGKYELRNYTGFDLLGLSGFPGYGYASVIRNPSVQTAQSKMIAMHFPSLATYGQFKLVHGTNRTFYDTFRTGEMTLHADVTIYPNESVYFIAPNQEEVLIDYEVRTIIDDDKTSLPYSNGVNISSVNIKSEHQEATVFSNPDLENKDLDRVLVTTFSKVVKASDLDLRDGKDTVTLSAFSEYADMTNYKVSFSATPVNVTVNAASDFMADFTIHDSEDEDVTDAHITLADLNFNTDVNVSVKDASVTSKGNIISRIWYVLKNGSYVPISTGNETNVVFAVTKENKASVLNANKLSFKLVVKTDLNEDEEVAIHEVTFQKSAPPQPVPSGPVAIITAKLEQNNNDDYKAMEGQVFDINGRESYHPEGLKLTKYTFNTKGGYTSSTGSKKNDYIYYLESGKYYPELTVTDENGGADQDSTTIIVRPAEFVPVISVEGTLKENRKVSVSVENEYNLRHFPIDEQSLDWTITPLDGQGDVVKIDGTADGSKAYDVLFKKKGRYRIDVLGDINSGYKRYSGSASTTISIAEDMAPVANFTVSSRHVRNINNMNMTEMKIYDNSYSLDNDIISQRKYWYRYDDDNDGDFGDTDWILLSAANFTTMSLFADQVGKYEFKVEVKEGFGQPTISTFIVDADYRRGDAADKMTEIINIAPTVTLEIANKKPVNLIVYHDFDTPALTDFKNKVEILKAQMLGKQIELEVEYLTPEKVVGEKERVKTFYDTYISIDLYTHYEYEASNGNDYEYRKILPIKIYLDSFSTQGEIPTQTIADRFKIISVEHQEDNGGYFDIEEKGKDGWAREEKTWSNIDTIRVTYTDHGAVKIANYKFAKDFSETRHTSAQSTSYDVYEANISGYKIVVDKATQGDRGFHKVNHTPTISDSWRMDNSLEPGGAVTLIPLKKYNDDILTTILNEIGDEEAFFLNLTKNEENRLALNKDLLEKLSSKNIHYMTLDDTSVAVNPLSGRYDEVTISKEGDLYFKVADTTYTVITSPVWENGWLRYKHRFLPVGDGLKFDAYNTNTFLDKYKEDRFSIYSNGYTYRDHWGDPRPSIGLDAMNKYRDSYGEGLHNSWWGAWDDYANNGGNNFSDFLVNYIPDQVYRDIVGIPTVEKDGNLVGYKYTPDFYNRGIILNAGVWGGGYLGTLKGVYFKDPTDESYHNPAQIRGFIHENGNIYFKYRANFGAYGYSLLDYFVITEGINNIDVIYKNDLQNAIYVITKDKKCVKYNIDTRTKETVASTFIERNGYSLKIGNNKWMADGVVYENVKQIHTDENRNSERIYNDNRGRGYIGKMTLKYQIDENDNYTVTKRFVNQTGTYDIERTYLLATDVRELPIRGVQENYGMNVYYGGSGSIYNPYSATYESYIGNDGYLYSAQRAMDAVYQFQIPTSYTTNKMVQGKVLNVDYVGDWTYENYQYPENPFKVSGLVTSTDDGELKIGGVELNYADLTVGNAGDVVGDNDLIGVSPLSKAFSSLDALLSGIYKSYENYSSTNSVYVVLDESIETTMTYDDYDNDPLYNMVYDFEHVNPNYFENSLGKDPNAGTGLLKPLTTLNYVGHYEVRPKVKDDPKDDDRFDNYRLENKDEALVNVYVHRRPVAQMTYRFGENTLDSNYFTFTALDNGSYDLDHLSESSKGIVDWKFSIKAEDESAWTTVHSKTFTHTKIRRGIEYTTVLLVKDKEGAWSLPLVKTFELEDVPVNIEAKLKSRDTGFSVDAMPITEFFNVYDIETEYHSKLKLEIALYDGDERKGNLITIPFAEGSSATTDSSNPNLVRWNPKDLQVPEKLPDKAYKLVVKAIDVANPSKTAKVEFDVGVRTPINPFPTIPSVFTANEEVELLCRTSKYTDSLDITLFKNTAKESTYPMIFDKEEGKYKYWKVNYRISEGLDDGTYQAEFTGTVNTVPQKTESVTRNFEYITLKIISAAMYPEDPMAGDKLIWVIESMGGVDRYELILEDDVINNDERKAMGYAAVDYPYYIEVDETQNRKSDQFEYVLWCTTPQSKTLKSNRNRPAYTFKIRAWKGKSYVDVDFIKEVVGDVRELIKVGY